MFYLENLIKPLYFRLKQDPSKVFECSSLDIQFSRSLINYSCAQSPMGCSDSDRSLIHDETLRACFGLTSYWFPRLMQAIPGEMKALVILISTDMPDESTDQNTIQPTYRLTMCFSVMSSLIPE